MKIIIVSKSYNIKFICDLNTTILSYMEIFTGDDEGGIPMGGVVRSIEEALMEYDIDTRTCLARTMCNQYQTKLEEEEKSTAARISRGILDNLAG